MPPNPPPTHNTLSAAPVITHPRRRKRDLDRSRRRPQRSKQQQEPDPLFSSLAQLSDTHFAFLTLKSNWPLEARNVLPNTPPLILPSQLRALLSSAGTISTEIRQLIKDGIARCVHLPSGEVALIPYDQLQPNITGCDAFFKADICSEWGSEAIVTERTLKKLVGDHGVDQLVKAGWLILRDEDSFWMTVPDLGKFIRERQAGTKELTTILKKEQYKEMDIKQLQERSMRNSCFTAQWHVRDLVGSGKLEAVRTDNDVIIRLTGRD